MTNYESKTVTINNSFNDVYNKISDLKNVESFKNKLPHEYQKEFICDTDYIKINIEQLGNVTFRIVERNSNNVKFLLENIPIKADMSLELREMSENTEMKISLNADVPFFLKPILGNKLQEGINQAAMTLARVLNDNDM